MKTALLFIHGFATGPAIWGGQARELSGNYRVIFSAEEIDHSDTLYIIGWSMGGWKAIDLYLEHPSRVKGLILVSAFAKYLKSDDYPFGTSPALLKRLEGRFKADYRSGLDYFYGLLFSDQKWHALANELPPPEKEDIDRWFDKLKNEDKRNVLPEIKVPALLIHGDRDEISPPGNSRFMHEKIPGSRLTILEGVGHAPMVEAPALFNAGLRGFIEENAG